MSRNTCGDISNSRIPESELYEHQSSSRTLIICHDTWRTAQRGGDFSDSRRSWRGSRWHTTRERAGEGWWFEDRPSTGTAPQYARRGWRRATRLSAWDKITADWARARSLATRQTITNARRLLSTDSWRTYRLNAVVETSTAMPI